MSISSRFIKGDIAVIGDETFVLGFRIAGATKYFVIDTSAPEEILRKELAKIFNIIYNDPSISLVIIHDMLKNVVERIRRAITYPLFIYVPDIKTAPKADVKEYYLSLIKHYLGISLELR